MAETRRRRVDEAFHAAFARERGARRAALLNPAPIRRDLERALSAATTLASYRDFLAAGRAHKAARRGTSLEFERELATQADGALRAARELGAATLRSARHIRNAGRFDEALDSWHDALRATRTVRLRDVLADVFDDPAAREALEEAGLTKAIRTELSSTLEPVGFRASVKAGTLRVEIPAGDGREAHTVRVARDPRPGRPRNVSDLLDQGRFDAITDALDTSRFALGDVVPATGATPDREPSELLLTGAMLIVQRTARHRRGLQDAGLALHEGRDPGTAGVLLVAAAVLAVAAFALALMCGEGNETACTVGAILFGLALLLMAGAVCLSMEPQSSDNGDGDPVGTTLCGMAVATAFSFIIGSVD